MNDYAIKAQNIKKNYAGVKVIRGLSLHVPKSKFTAIVGKSGSGKSTLLAIVSGLEKPDEGRVLVQGTDIFTLDDKAMAAMRRRSLGFVFQGFNLVPSLTAIENVLLPLVFNKNMTAEDKTRRAEELLTPVGIGDRCHHRPSALSGGEQQRVAIARALVNEPEILLADEPTGNLDETTAKGVVELLLGLCRDRGTTLLMVTHDVDIAARADKKITIRDGRIEHEDKQK